MDYRLLIINPGSTSTKIAVYDNDQEIFKVSIPHKPEDLAKYDTTMDQLEYRTGLVEQTLTEQNIPLSSLSAIIARGGLLPPIKAGAYKVNEDMVWQLRNKPGHEHASNLAAVIGYEMGKKLHIDTYIYDGVTVEEMDEIIKVTGVPSIRRTGMGHNLNMRAMAIKYAQEHNKAYKDIKVIVAHLGGGFSVSYHNGGRIADIMSDENGSFTPERAGALPTYQLIHLAYSGKYSEKEMMRLLKTGSGLMAYLGTIDSRDVEAMIEKDDEKAKFIYEAMALNLSKSIWSLGGITNGDVEAIILTGGIGYSKMFTQMVTERVSNLAPVFVYPGENEMFALATGGLRVLRGEEECHTFVKSE